VRVDIARDLELVAKMRAAGCCKVYVGFESLDPAALLAFKKHQTVDDIRKAVSVLHDHRIAVHGMFVLGCDDEGDHNARDVLDFCRNHRIDSAQFMILTPFPGTPLFEEMNAAGRLLHTDWALYDAMHVVFRPAHRTPLDLQREMVEAFHEFYSYRGAARDGILGAADLVWSLRHDPVERVRSLGAESALLKVGGRSILRRFMRDNRTFLASLAREPMSAATQRKWSWPRLSTLRPPIHTPSPSST